MNEETVCIDLGSYSIKGGFAIEDSPRAIIESIIGTPNRGN